MRRIEGVVKHVVGGVSKTEVNAKYLWLLKDKYPEALRVVVWKEVIPRPPPQERRVAEPEQCYDYGYFDRICI